MNSKKTQGESPRDSAVQNNSSSGETYDAPASTPRRVSRADTFGPTYNTTSSSKVKAPGRVCRARVGSLDYEIVFKGNILTSRSVMFPNPFKTRASAIRAITDKKLWTQHTNCLFVRKVKE